MCQVQAIKSNEVRVRYLGKAIRLAKTLEKATKHATMACT